MGKTYPKEDEMIYFRAAEAFVRKVSKPRLVSGTSAHRTQSIKLGSGYLVIDHEWYSTGATS